jgi:hypothetical protein
MAHRKRLGFPGLLLLVAVAGCGGSKLYPVEGKIVYPDGQAAVELAGASVEFDPVEGKEGARGQVQADGSFRMGTFQPADGVVPGSYRVCIQPPLPDLDRPVPSLLPRRYGDFQTSGLQVTIKPEKNPLTLIVERAKPKR